MDVREVEAKDELFGEDCVYVDNGITETLFYGSKIETVFNE